MKAISTTILCLCLITVSCLVALAQGPPRLAPPQGAVPMHTTSEFNATAPDLAVMGFELIGAPHATNDPGQGQCGSTCAAVSFRVVVENLAQPGPRVFPVDAFKVEVVAQGYTPVTPAEYWVNSLAPGEQTVVQGEIVFSDQVVGNAVPLIAIADSCEGERTNDPNGECRVREAREGNNRSNPVTVNFVR